MADRGTVTFVFTDIEGSTRLLKELRDRYGDLLAEHQRIVRDAFASRGGEEVDTQGDAFFFVFSRARDAANAAADAQRALAAFAWPEGAEFRVRIGIHTGEPNISDAGRYTGLGVHRAARIMAAGHGGQILASQASASVLADDEPAGIRLKDLGEYRLKDLDRPERIWQLDVDGLPQRFPPLRTADKPSGFWTPRRRLAGAGAGALTAALALGLFLVLQPQGLSRVDANALGVIDVASGKISAQVPVGATPTHVAVGEGSIWVANADDHTISRIDPAKRSVVDTIDVPGTPGGIATGSGFVWVTNSLENTVSKIDPKAGKVVDTIDVGNRPAGVVVAGESVWVANTGDDTITRIDPPSRDVTTIEVGANEFTFGAGSLWATQRNANRVARIDPVSGNVVQRISVGNGPSDLAFGGGGVWIANSLDGTVSRIDPETNSVSVTLPTGSGPAGVAFGAGSVWISNEFDGTVTRIDTRTGQAIRRIRVGNRPQGVAISGDDLVVTVRQSGAGHRGGTLTIRTARAVDSIDMAVAYDTSSWPFLRMTNDGLVAFNQTSGLAGAQLVPDLAVSLPSPTNGGKTYTFHLRPGLRYSNAAPVKASDVRATFERLFKVGKLPVHYYDGIVGVAACKKNPAGCDLSSGIATDDTMRSVTFHLVAPNPEFAYALALPFAYIVPAGSPAEEVTSEPLLGTGPYVIESYEPGKVLKLVRNKHFKEWSKAAQPQGYPDLIVFQTGGTPDEAMDDVVEGKGDIATTLNSGTPSRKKLDDIQANYASQVHSNPFERTFALFLNTRLAPFNRLDVRRALNYAVDRAAAVEAAGGPAVAEITCQIIPKNLPGYRPYCPFTAGSSKGGTWTGPDLAKARALVKASGTSGMKVTAYYYAQAPAFGAFIKNLLTSVGYRPTLKVLDDDYFSKAYDTRTNAQIGFFPWSSDYPAPSGFFSPVLTCGSIVRNDRGNLNPALFCDPSIDRQISDALRFQGVDPESAHEEWASVDRRTVDQAPWVPLVNGKSFDVVSKRVGNYQYNPAWGVLIDQLWLR